MIISKSVQAKITTIISFTLSTMLVGLCVLGFNLFAQQQKEQNINKSVDAIYHLYDLYHSRFMTMQEVEKFSPMPATTADKQNVLNFCETMFEQKDAIFMDVKFKDILTQNVNTCAELGTKIKNKELTYASLYKTSSNMVNTYTQSEYKQLKYVAENKAREELYAQLESRAEKSSNRK